MMRGLIRSRAPNLRFPAMDELVSALAFACLIGAQFLGVLVLHQERRRPDWRELSAPRGRSGRPKERAADRDRTSREAGVRVMRYEA